MKYQIRYKPRAIKDIQNISKKDSVKILNKIKSLEKDFSGDIKKLTAYSPEYRLRVGNYRILFEIDENDIIIYSVKHRKDAY